MTFLIIIPSFFFFTFHVCSNHMLLQSLLQCSAIRGGSNKKLKPRFIDGYTARLCLLFFFSLSSDAVVVVLGTACTVVPHIAQLFLSCCLTATLASQFEKSLSSLFSSSLHLNRKENVTIKNLSLELRTATAQEADTYTHTFTRNKAKNPLSHSLFAFFSEESIILLAGLLSSASSFLPACCKNDSKRIPSISPLFSSHFSWTKEPSAKKYRKLSRILQCLSCVQSCKEDQEERWEERERGDGTGSISSQRAVKSGIVLLFVPLPFLSAPSASSSSIVSSPLLLPPPQPACVCLRGCTAGSTSKKGKRNHAKWSWGGERTQREERERAVLSERLPLSSKKFSLCYCEYWKEGRWTKMQCFALSWVSRSNCFPLSSEGNCILYQNEKQRRLSLSLSSRTEDSFSSLRSERKETEGGKRIGTWRSSRCRVKQRQHASEKQEHEVGGKRTHWSGERSEGERENV